MLNQYDLKMPGSVLSGKNALDKIQEILSGQAEKVAVFTDKGVREAGVLEIPLSRIKAAVSDIVILDGLPTEPSYVQAQQIIEEFKRTKADFIVAVGGGSVMDIAKLASVLATDQYTVKDLLEDPSAAKKHIKTLMIPTTAGTGSEATPNSIVTVPEKELKVGIVNENMIADYVILDPIMIRTLPRSIAAATGIDALAHAIECFTSKKSNPFSNLFALEALDLILNHIERACDDCDAMDAKQNMLIGSFFAGVAITASGTTAVHALSYPLGGKYHIPHGVSNAIMLAPVMRFNEPVCRERFAFVYDRVVKKPKQLTVEEKSKWIIERLTEIVTNLDIPMSLKQYGVSSEDLDALVASGMEVQRLLVNNMREVTPDDARRLYLEIL